MDFLQLVISYSVFYDKKNLCCHYNIFAYLLIFQEMFQVKFKLKMLPPWPVYYPLPQQRLLYPAQVLHKHRPYLHPDCHLQGL